MTLSIAKYDDDAAFYVVNEADYNARLNALDDGAPDIMKELRHETIDIILRTARKAGEQVNVPYVGPPRFIRNGETI